MEKIYDSLEKKNELLIGQMMKNFGRTQQDLPNFKLPDIPSNAKRPTLFEMQSSTEEVSAAFNQGG